MSEDKVMTIAVIAGTAAQSVKKGLEEHGIPKAENWEVTAGMLTASLTGLVGDIATYKPTADPTDTLLVMSALRKGPKGLADLITTIIGVVHTIATKLPDKEEAAVWN